MNEKTTATDRDLGVVTTLLTRFLSGRLGRILEIRDKLLSGERLDREDLSFLNDSFHSARQAQPLLDRLPGHQELYCRVMALYKEIADQALANEMSVCSGQGQS